MCLAAISMELHFQRFGSGPPLVILHGLLGSSDNWISLARRFAEQFEVFALDLRNHGRSPHGESMSLGDMAEDVVRFANARNFSRFAMVGHSLGGKVAMETALWRPDLVDRLIVVDMAPRAYAPRHVKLIEALEALDLSALRNRTEALAALEESVPSLPMRQFFLKNLRSTDSGGIEWRINLRGVGENYSFLNQALEAGRMFEGPTLLLRGGKSDYVTDEDGDAMGGLFPALKFETIANAGHWVHAEAPDTFYEIASRFLCGGH